MNKGVISRGIVCPIVREGDNIVEIVVESLLGSGVELNDMDVVGITESLVARSAGLYVSVDGIAEDVRTKFGADPALVLLEPIYSRNRFSMILKGIARAASKITLVMPEFDEVGNPRGVNRFTGVNIEEYYKELCASENCACEVVYDRSEAPADADGVIWCGLHLTEDVCVVPGMKTLKDICSDLNPDVGLLGSNKATEERLKLFPTTALADRVCEAVKAGVKERTGRDVVVLVYGDGCFKDPVGGIWEFADPMTCPGYTDKDLLESTPAEVKLKYWIDRTDASDEEITEMVGRQHAAREKGMNAMGTTPRIYKDLLASLMDLTSGSGDRGTPVILVQNYF